MFLDSNKTSVGSHLIIKIRNRYGAKMVVGDLAGDETKLSVNPEVESQRTFINSTLTDFYTFTDHMRQAYELLYFFDF